MQPSENIFLLAAILGVILALFFSVLSALGNKENAGKEKKGETKDQKTAIISTRSKKLSRAALSLLQRKQ